MGRHAAHVQPQQGEVASSGTEPAMPAPWAHGTRPSAGLPRALAPAQPARRVLDPVADRIQRDLRTIRTLRPQAPGHPPAWAPAPAAASGSGPTAPTSLDVRVPAHELRPAARSAREIEDDLPDAVPGGFSPRRTLALAACAMAVLSVVSGAAVLLPDGSTGGAAGAAENHVGAAGSSAAGSGATP